MGRVSFWMVGGRAGFRFSGFGSLVSGLGFRVSGLEFLVSGFWFRVSGLEFLVSGFGVKGYRACARTATASRPPCLPGGGCRANEGLWLWIIWQRKSSNPKTQPQTPVCYGERRHIYLSPPCFSIYLDHPGFPISLKCVPARRLHRGHLACRGEERHQNETTGTVVGQTSFK